MGRVLPCPRSQVGQVIRQDWHTVFRPSWETLVAVGYVNDAGTRAFTEKVEELGNADGEVGLMGGALVKQPFRPLSPAGEDVYIYAEAGGDVGKTFQIRGIRVDGTIYEEENTITAFGEPLQLAEPLVHVNAIRVLDTPGPKSRSGLSAEGPVWCSNDSLGLPDPDVSNVQCVARPGRNTGLNSRQKAAEDQVIVINAFVFGAAKGDENTIRVYVGDDTIGRYDEVLEVTLFQTAFSEVLSLPTVIQEGQWIEVTAQRVSSNNTDVTAAFTAYEFGAGSQFPPPPDTGTSGLVFGV